MDTVATNLDIFDLVRWYDMEEGGIAPLLVAPYNPTIRVARDPDHVVFLPKFQMETTRDHLITNGWSRPIEVPSPGSPIFPTVLSC